MENKDDILKGLYGIKEELSKEIFELENKLYLTRCSLDDINDEICKIGGHCFGDWKQTISSKWLNEDVYRDVFCYKRECNICGKVEITYSAPDAKIRSKKK